MQQVIDTPETQTQESLGIANDPLQNESLAKLAGKIESVLEIL